MANYMQPRTYQHPFEYLFSPRSIAIVGASDTPGKIGHILMKNVKNFQGRSFPVNLKKPEILGLPAYPSVRDIPGEIDVAIISVPRKYAKSVVRDCAEKGVRFGVLITAGFGEIGLKHEEEEILHIAQEAGMRLLGPNCVGYGNTWTQLNASFLRYPEQGKIGFISQSGGNGELLFSEALQGHLGFSKYIAIGNALDLHFDELIRYLVTDDETDIIMLYIESIREGKQFIETLRYAAGKKPIVALKGGVSSSGMRATISHTGSLSTDAAMYRTIFKQFGVLQVETLEEMIDVANILRLPPMKGENVVVITNSGGTGVIAGDLLEQEGFTVPVFPEETQKQLKIFLPDIASTQNPLDLGVEASKEDYGKIFEVVHKTEKPDAFFFSYASPGYQTEEQREAVVDHVVQTVKELNLEIPLVSCSLPSTALFLKKRFESFGFPSFMTQSRGVYALKMLYVHSTQHSSPQPQVCERVYKESCRSILAEAIRDKRLLLDEDECRRILRYAGFQVPKYAHCTTLDECIATAKQLAYPIVLKVSSPTITHKSDVGGIITGVQSEDELKSAFSRIIMNVTRYHAREDISGVFLSEQISKGQELLLGIKRDPTFGAFIMLGLGGIFVEVFKDISLRLAPISVEEARSMVDELKAAPLLYGVRGQQGIDRKMLIDDLVKLGNLAVQCPEIEELDINPLIALPEGQGCHVADVRILVGSALAN